MDRRSIAWIPVALWALVFLPARGGEDSALGAREVGLLVEEYCGQSVDPARKTGIVRALRDAPPSLVSRKLAPALTDAGRRREALGLAGDLRLSGLLKEAKQCLGTDDEDRAVRLLFSARDPKAHRLLLDLWKGADPDGETFRLLCDGFASCPVDAAVVAGFKPFLEKGVDDPRRARALAILKAQMHLPTENPVEIIAHWPRLWKTYELEARAFPMTGVDLLGSRPWAVSGGAPIGNNVKLDKGGVVRLEPGSLPACIQKGDFTLKIRILLLEGEGASVQFCISSGEAGKVRGFFPVFRNGEWSVQTGELKQIAIPGRKGEWVPLAYEVTDQSSGTVRWDRTVRILVGEKVLMERGNFSGEFSCLAIASGEGALVIGGVELIHK